MKSLGISHLYASPIFRARSGSLHGYDVTDPRELNPELGTGAELEQLTRALSANGMALLLDIVPNHMAARWENPWWWDVLENGKASAWAEAFDIDWDAGDGKLLLPVLGDTPDRVLRKGELQLALSERGFFVSYFDARFPLDPNSYSPLLDFMLGELAPGATTRKDLARLAAGYRSLPTRAETAAERTGVRRRQKESLNRELSERYRSDSAFHTLIDEGLARCGSPSSADWLATLLGAQPYQLCHWKEGNRRISYRRFFDVSDLVGVRVELTSVFEQTHRKMKELAQGDQIQAVRVDHIDGLYDPLKYLQRLQAYLKSDRDRRPFPVWVEKILAEDEELPPQWPVEGTSGYDALNSLNGVFVDSRGLKVLGGIYARFIGDWTSWKTIVYRQKRRILEELFGGELDSLSRLLQRLVHRMPGGKTLTLESLRNVLAASIAYLPVYRTYIQSFSISKKDRERIEETLRESMRRRSHQDRRAWLFLRRVLLLQSPQRSWLHFVRKWQQLTGPVMAKGFEDTALYRYHRLVSLNEVGGDPGGSYASLDDFHERNRRRQQSWPRSLVATSTHDTKRSEDVRARINVLSERPEVWRAALHRWSRWNRDKRISVGGTFVPCRKEEVFFYQTILGAWPLREDALEGFRDRICDHVIKAAREAKEFTSWLDPNEAHENALIAFAKAVLDPNESNRFLSDFRRFSEPIAFSGALNSMGQVLLKIAAPGIPDFYQGTVLWNLSLVDPDNRRPVDFTRRVDALEQLPDIGPGDIAPQLEKMLSSWKDGRMKLFTISRGLALRSAAPELFLSGEYLPLDASGPRRGHVCSFARHREGAWAVVVVPRLTSKLLDRGRQPLGDPCWKKTHLRLPSRAPDQWENVLTGETLTISRSGETNRLPLSKVLRAWPAALLAGPPRP